MVDGEGVFLSGRKAGFMVMSGIIASASVLVLKVISRTLGNYKANYFYGELMQQERSYMSVIHPFYQ